MPPKKRPIRPPPRRSGRRAVLEEEGGGEDASAEVEAEGPEEPRSANAQVLETEHTALVNPEAGDHGDVDDDDTVMRDAGDAGRNPIEAISASSRPPPPPPPSNAVTQSPTQRLTSLVSSAPPNPLVSTDPPHSRPMTTTMKFKPKPIIRRSKEEREAAEQAERERLIARHHAVDADSSERERGRGRGGTDGRGGRRGRGGGAFPLDHGYGFVGGNKDRGGGAGATSRRGGMDARIASGPLGGATVGVARRRGRWGGQGSGVEVGEEGAGVDDDDVVETAGGAAKRGKGKGKGAVKEESSVKPEGGGKDGGVGAGAGKKGKRKRDSAVVGAGAGVETVKAKGRAKVKKEEDAPTYISSEGEFDSDTAEKINIEAINLVSSEEEADDESGVEVHTLSAVARGKQKDQEFAKAAEARKAKNWMNRPVHVQRLEHVERVIGVNTDASSLTSAELRRRAKERRDGEGSLFIDEAEPESSSGLRKGRSKPKDVEFVRDERKWKGRLCR